jgi:hypothetical protein
MVPKPRGLSHEQTFLQYFNAFLNLKEFKPIFTPFLDRTIGPHWFVHPFPPLPECEEEITAIWKAYCWFTRARTESETDSKVKIETGVSLITLSFLLFHTLFDSNHLYALVSLSGYDSEKISRSSNRQSFEESQASTSLHFHCRRRR